MSFILDALKKSESERQRQSGPALFEVKVAPPRNRFAIWAIALGGLLAINFVVVGWLLWRGDLSRPATARVAAASAQAAPTAQTPLPATPVASPAGNSPSAPAAHGAGEARMQANSSAVSRAAAPPLVAQAGAAASTGGNTPAGADTASAGAAGEAGVSPDDLAPAVEPGRSAQGSARREASTGGQASLGTQTSPGVIRETASGLPTYQQAASEPGSDIPALRLDLHVYSPQSDQRFAFLNMMKVHEGDTLPKGVHVDRITPDGVILSYHGKQFVLLRQ